MFKQHVDSVHRGITSSQVVSAGQQIILSPNNVISTTQSGQTLAVNPLTITPGGAATQVVQASQGQILHTASGQQMTLVTGVKSAAPGVVTLSPTPTQGQVTGQVTVTRPSLATSGVLTSMAGTSGGGQLATVATAGQVSVNNAVTAAVTTVVHKCPKCGFLAPSKNQLTQHRKKFHGKQTAANYAVNAAPSAPVSAAAAAAASGKKTFNCSTCGYTTTRRDGLSQHYDSVHLKIKNHQCSLCPYAASQKGTLNRHVKLRHKKKDELLLGQ